MMDVTKLLEQDHRKVESLFAQYETDQSADVLTQICDELEVHTTLEEELVYPRLAELDRDLEHHAQAEHDQAKLLIDQIRVGDPDVSTLARQLQMAIEAHVREEEGRAFPLLREQMGSELQTIGDEVARRKEQLTTAS